MIYFRFYLEAYDSATDELSMLEHGAYLALMRKYYKDEKPLPLGIDTLARACRAISQEERSAIQSVLGRFFTEGPDGWHNERADHEIAMAKTARANGSRGGRPTEDETEQETGTESHSVTGSETTSVTTDATTARTGSGHPSSLLTKTIHSTSQPLNQLPSARASRSGRKSAPCETGDTWKAFSEAYVRRYGVEPARNARVNGQIATLVRCIGAQEAPSVAEFYVQHNRALYVQAKHPASLLGRDAEGLRTEWATGRRVSETEARQSDRTMATGNAFAPLIAEAEAARTETPVEALP